MSRQEAAALWTGLQDDIPAGYEDLVAAYYRRLAEGTPTAAEADAKRK